VLREILRGSADVLAAAGAVLAGGHSIDDAEPKYGLAVTGTVDPRALVTNAGGARGGCARADQAARHRRHHHGAQARRRRRRAPRAAAVDVMATLNAEAARAALAAGAHAMIDVTGFGLLGHLHGLARETGVAARVQADAVPRSRTSRRCSPMSRPSRAARGATPGTRRASRTWMRTSRPGGGGWRTTRRPRAGC
jgi:selenide,water dikinase